MENIHVKGKVLVNQASGNVRILSRDGRLSFPLQVIDTCTAARREIRNYMELLNLVKEVRKNKNTKTVSKSMVIRERINMLLRNLHEPA